MGSAHDIMQTFASKDLHAQFPEYDGWEWTILPGSNSGTLMYRVFRNYHYNLQESFLTVSFDPKPSAGCIAALTLVVTDNLKPTSRYLLVPQGTDVSGIPAGIKILTMTSFGFSEGKLTWLSKKKNAAHYPQKESVPA